MSYDLAQVLTEASLRLADGNPDFGPACVFPTSSRGLVQDIPQCRDVVCGGNASGPSSKERCTDAPMPARPLGSGGISCQP